MKIYCPKACGECCKVVTITNNHKIKLQTQWLKENGKSQKFYLKHFTQIRKRKAIKLRPILAVHSWSGITYFICDYYDFKINKCKGYKKWRPRMCTHFPFYDKVVIDTTTFTTLKNCYFVNQLMVRSNNV